MSVAHPNLDALDGLYKALIDAHRDRALDQSHSLDARLLLLANRNSSLPVSRQALEPVHASRASATH